VLIRHGVRLTARQAEIFDAIERAGQRGVLCEVLAGMFYPDKPRPAAEKLIAVHIHDLNNMLEETDVLITSGRWRSPYRVARRQS
jgi:hypothetical protein